MKLNNFFLFLPLVVLKGHLAFSGITTAKVESAIYAANSIVGGHARKNFAILASFGHLAIRGRQQISILGNLAVENLNRQKDEEGPLIMPKRVLLNYDTNLKSQTGNNVCFNISDLLLSFRDF